MLSSNDLTIFLRDPVAAALLALAVLVKLARSARPTLLRSWNSRPGRTA